ncbi:PREDICTED: myb-like protein P [Priapulus caudatus]|uniref:Myb-like protein P n=1 Tax=Priapulus caudatus TaxID=37621 RepID=A0ABM1EH83_PRICU|nr:PREDICTED: myb-like protein P [Priapulus caudatus]
MPPRKPVKPAKQNVAACAIAAAAGVHSREPTPPVTGMPDFNQTAHNQIVPQPVYMSLEELEQTSKQQQLPQPPPQDQQQQQQLQQQQLQQQQQQQQQCPTSAGGQNRASMGGATQELAQALQRRLSRESGSRQSLQSSGYGTQPPSESDAFEEFDDMYNGLVNKRGLDKYCTLPRNFELSPQLKQLLSRRHNSVSACPEYFNAKSVPGGATVGRASAAKPPPPVRRTSSVTAPTSMQKQFAGPKTSAKPAGYARSHSIAGDMHAYGGATTVAGAENGDESQTTTPVNSDDDAVLNRVSLIHSLNSKFAESLQHSTAMTGLQHPPGVSPRRSVHTEEDSDELPPPPPDVQLKIDLLSQIRHGVELSHSFTNDRSAPKIMMNQ